MEATRSFLTEMPYVANQLLAQEFARLVRSDWLKRMDRAPNQWDSKASRCRGALADEPGGMLYR